MSGVQMVAAAIFACAVLHTFLVKWFEALAHRYPSHKGIFHLLAEVEVVFGFWAFILIIFLASANGTTPALAYLDSRNFTEPLFVFAIMVVAASRSILSLCESIVNTIARVIPLAGSASYYFVILCIVPLLGSFITEPAAMTLAALLLRSTVLSGTTSSRLRYATVGVLFVNVSIGGTLTPFAAPPVLMVAGPWGWDLAFMLKTFGWKSAIAVTVNAVAITVLFMRELSSIPRPDVTKATGIPPTILAVHVLTLVGIVLFAHHPAAFMGLFLFFMGIATAYPQYQDRLILREGLLVAFFLAGLVVLGGQQQWWLEPMLKSMSESTVYYGATALTAITDNAALTYLGSLVQGLSPEFKYSLVAGAVTGGGLTVIANAPNPAGYSILKEKFEDQSISPLGLFLAALPPTLVAIAAFRLL